MIDTVDFTAHPHPVLAVSCPTCGARVGASCIRPSEHRTRDYHYHATRRREADRIFIAQYGEDASIDRTDSGGWMVDPAGRLREAAG